jgi:hypothetical protein
MSAEVDSPEKAFSVENGILYIGVILCVTPIYSPFFRAAKAGIWS